MATRRKQKIKAFAVTVVLISFATLLAFSALAAGHGGGGSRSAGAPISGQQTDLRGFRDRGFFGGEVFGEGGVTIEQFQSAPAAEPAQPANKGRYVQPHWVDGGYGVQILEPGYWTGIEAETKR